MNKKQTLFFLAVILIIASFLRLYNLMPADNSGRFSPPGLYPDEAMNGNNAVEAIASGNWKVFYPENFGREGLFINIQGLSVMALGNTPWALRLPSALFGILTVLGLYFLAKELLKNEQVALFSAFLLATSFWHIIFSRIGFRAIMAPAFLVWSVFLLLSAFGRVKDAYRFSSGYSKITWLLSVFAGAVYGLGMYSYIAYRATPLLILLLGYLFWKNSDHESRPKILGILLIFISASLIVSAPLLNYFWNNPADFFGRTAGISVLNSASPIRDLALNIIKTAGMFNVAGDFNWRHNFAGRPELFLPVGLFFLYGIYLSGKKIRNKKLSAIPEAVLLGWLAIVALPVVISNEGLPHALRSILLIPPVFVLSAIGGMHFYDSVKFYVHSGALRFMSYIFLSVLILEVSVVYFLAWTNHPAVRDSFDYRDYVLSERINSLPRAIPKYIIVSGTDRTIERDYPISLQSVLFLTDTFSDEKRSEKNIEYLTESEFKSLRVPVGSTVIFR